MITIFDSVFFFCEIINLKKPLRAYPKSFVTYCIIRQYARPSGSMHDQKG